MSLAAGESAQFKLKVTITSSAKSGSSYKVTAKGTSASDSSVYDGRELTITVT